MKAAIDMTNPTVYVACIIAFFFLGGAILASPATGIR